MTGELSDDDKRVIKQFDDADFYSQTRAIRDSAGVQATFEDHAESVGMTGITMPDVKDFVSRPGSDDLEIYFKKAMFKQQVPPMKATKLGAAYTLDTHITSARTKG